MVFSVVIVEALQRAFEDVENPRLTIGRVTVAADGEVSVGPEPIGHLAGFDFRVDPAARLADKRLLLAAAERRLGDELDRRARALLDAPDDAFELIADPEGRVAVGWQGHILARLAPGQPIGLAAPPILARDALGHRSLVSRDDDDAEACTPPAAARGSDTRPPGSEIQSARGARASRICRQGAGPGKALVVGRAVPDLSGLAAVVEQGALRQISVRLPATLPEAVEFYDRRFQIGLTAQEKSDLVEFMKSLTGKPMQVALPQLPQ